MCGRMNVIAAPITQYLQEQLGLDFQTIDNSDLRPTQRVDVIMSSHKGLLQVTTHWGIQPKWAKHILINAKIETAAQKATFKRAYAESRCLIPVSGWYEWRLENERKQKYLFSARNQQPLLMAGIVFKGEQGPELVTFTTAPTPTCAAYHDRMPLIIPSQHIDYWFHSTPAQLDAVARHVDDDAIEIIKC
ncbi:SOS response-associated peptidase [Pseudidiomarina salilacus]|uniref:SOS response-associated peptidase n=1 Tax=Pseudidiomarina salilacus TaxID=3384452 RepID=UPI003984ABD5